jgi:hypothetical protein
MSVAPVKWTARVLLLGTLASAILFGAGFLLGIAGYQQLGTVASNAGVVVLLATPAFALITTMAELRETQPQASVLAVGVLGVLAVAVGVALLAH